MLTLPWRAARAGRARRPALLRVWRDPHPLRLRPPLLGHAPMYSLPGVVPALGVQQPPASLPPPGRPAGAALQVRVPLGGAEVPLLPSRGPCSGVPDPVRRGAHLPLPGSKHPRVRRTDAQVIVRGGRLLLPALQRARAAVAVPERHVLPGEAAGEDATPRGVRAAATGTHARSRGADPTVRVRSVHRHGAATAPPVQRCGPRAQPLLAGAIERHHAAPARDARHQGSTFLAGEEGRGLGGGRRAQCGSGTAETKPLASASASAPPSTMASSAAQAPASDKAPRDSPYIALCPVVV